VSRDRREHPAMMKAKASSAAAERADAILPSPENHRRQLMWRGSWRNSSQQTIDIRHITGDFSPSLKVVKTSDFASVFAAERASPISRDDAD
jgi:hypothetical protein